MLTGLQDHPWCRIEINSQLPTSGHAHPKVCKMAEMQRSGSYTHLSTSKGPHIPNWHQLCNVMLEMHEQWVIPCQINTKNTWPSQIWTKPGYYILSVDTFTHSQFQRYTVCRTTSELEPAKKSILHQILAYPLVLNSPSLWVWLTLWPTICSTCSA